MGLGVDIVVDGTDRAVAEDHVEATGVGAAEGVIGIRAGHILAGLKSNVVCGPPHIIAIVSDIQALVVTRGSAGMVVISVNAFFPNKIGIARTVHELGNFDLASTVNNARGLFFQSSNSTTARWDPAFIAGLAAIPEPSTLILWATATLCVVGLRRRA